MNLSEGEATGRTMSDPSAGLRKLAEARCHDPFRVLGRHRCQERDVIRVYLPHASAARLSSDGPALQRVADTHVFETAVDGMDLPRHYRIHWVDGDGREHESWDPYTFPPQLSDFDLHLFGEGRHWNIYRVLGAQRQTVDGIEGTRFATWAPHADRISVVGDFNGWDGRCHPMHVHGGSGVWELFIPEVPAGTLYKFEIRNRESGAVCLKSDPYGQEFQLRPETASLVYEPTPSFQWTDERWLEDRAMRDWQHAPLSIYELHLGSWRRDCDGNFLNYRDLARQIVPYVKEQGFTHIELMPISEHPLDASWGYQTTGYFAPTRRFGTPDDFRYFIDYCHRYRLGVVLDWVPAHFPKDAHGLAKFDGTALYEHADPRLGEHRDWGTLIYNYGRNEVSNFLIGSALFWIEECHVDGLRVDAVASMLYLDYSRQPGDWVPNKYGGNENLEAIAFLRTLNSVTQERHPGVLLMAEESTAWPQVTRPPWTGGLGFSMKWNMGWMHDTLSYMEKDPVHRHYHHDQLTFGLLYAFTENFVLPFSHDEVVHGKRSLLYRMPGDEWQQFANLRCVYSYMFTYPGKKLLFMGCEFGQGQEWDFNGELDWYVLDYPLHRGIHRLVADLNRLYTTDSCLHRLDFDAQGFEWIDCHDAPQSILSYLRRDEDRYLVVVLNLTPVPRHGYRVGVPDAGCYREILNSDASIYGGSNLGNSEMDADDHPWMGRPYSIQVTLPPLAAIVLKRATTRPAQRQ